MDTQQEDEDVFVRIREKRFDREKRAISGRKKKEEVVMDDL